MSIHYILDGYNIIKSDITEVFEGKSLEAQRNLLVEILGQKRPQGAGTNKVTVVFDGNSLYKYPDAKSNLRNNIEIVFSDDNTADDRIETIVLGVKNRTNIVVVTDDKGLRRRLGTTGVKYLDVNEFWARIDRRKSVVNRNNEDSFFDEITREMKDKWIKRQYD